jgi:phosphatidylethanolamine-binding protein (PEBP) family uncharacterized protein
MGNLQTLQATVLLLTAATLTLALLTGCGESKTKTTSKTSVAHTPSVLHIPGVKIAPATTPAPPTNTSTSSAKTGPAKVAEEPAPTEEKVEISSPVVHQGGNLPSRYTCDGQDEPLPLRWKGIPPGTSELALDILSLKPIKNTLYFNWALTHLKPTSHGINPGTLPPGALTGTISTGHTSYTICPPKGATEKYAVVLFAINRPIPAKNAFNARNQREQALRNAKYEGFLIFNYRRH